MELPNGIDINKIEKLLILSDRQDVTIQAWHGQTAVFIEKDGVDLFQRGGDADFALDESIDYLQRVNRSEVSDTSIEKLQEENERLRQEIKVLNDRLDSIYI